MPRLSSALLCLTAVGCADPVAPLPGNGPPRSLVYVGGGWGPYTRVELAGDTVALRSRRWESTGEVVTEARRVPSAGEWRTFWEALREAGVRRWPERCPGDPLYDGPAFEFTMAWRGGTRTGVYFGSRPTAAGRCSTTDHAAASRFQRAVLGVAGVTAEDELQRLGVPAR